MSIPPLSPPTTKRVLAHLGVTAASPTLSLLHTLVDTYIRTVPWESAFRIAKRVHTKETANCPRWPDEFWGDNIAQGGGGTCFESNYAFFSLLRALGYEGYLTINNMGDSIGCHSAIMVLVDGAKWLVDAGLPLYASLPVTPHQTTQRVTPFMCYTVRPDSSDIYQIEQAPHPTQPIAFTLIDKPVANGEYRAATTADYESTGLFLDKVIINKIIPTAAGDRPWRFNAAELPWRLNYFWQGIRTDKELEGDAAAAVARHFGMDEEVVRIALTATQDQGSGSA